MIFRNPFGSSLQLVLESEDVLVFTFRMRLWWSEEFYEVRGRDDIPQTTWVSLNVGSSKLRSSALFTDSCNVNKAFGLPDCGKFVTSRLPTTCCNYTVPTRTN